MTVDAWLEALEHPDKDTLRALRALVLAVDPRVSEGIKWNAGSFRTTEWFATFRVQGPRGPSPVTLVLHLGAKARSDVRARIPDPEGRLEWKGPDRALLSFAPGEDLEAAGVWLRPLLRAWVEAVGG